ncbi:hypothetical protein [Aquisalimonas sp.]|uniref:hypothetical protein n=1 Tax=Aquisalimonas sp. TaxID=1872621 RepID=UPI0025BB69BB|nr:hypothetical protein [Aquisalimonas sp.]
MSIDNEPLTPAEANEYEATTRRRLWIGLALIVTVVVLLIVVIMESRFRLGLGDPQPSAALDERMEAVLAELAPLPGDAREIHVRTRGDRAPHYAVIIRDADGAVLYELTRGAATAGLVEHGTRAGDAVSYRVNLTLDGDGGLVEGAYRPDRGVAVERYQEIAEALLRETVAAWHVHTSHPLEGVEEQSSDAIFDAWDEVID